MSSFRLERWLIIFLWYLRFSFQEKTIRSSNVSVIDWHILRCELAAALQEKKKRMCLRIYRWILKSNVVHTSSRSFPFANKSQMKCSNELCDINDWRGYVNENANESGKKRKEEEEEKITWLSKYAPNDFLSKSSNFEHSYQSCINFEQFFFFFILL